MEEKKFIVCSELKIILSKEFTVSQCKEHVNKCDSCQIFFKDFIKGIIPLVDIPAMFKPFIIGFLDK